MRRNRYLSPLYTPIFIVKECLHRMPRPAFDWKFGPLRDDLNPHTAVASLKEDGIVQFRKYFQGEFLNSLKHAFDAIIMERSEGGQGNPNAEYCENILDFDFMFLEAALDSTLLEIIAGYYGKPFAIGRADALRILPFESDRYGSFQWHHDARGRQIKAQILLTDVVPEGQRMTFMKGSHRNYYSHWRGNGEGSRFELDVATRPELETRLVNVAGQAGTVTLFDTNGLHSGNRNNSATRDTLTIYYPTSRNFGPLRYRSSHLARLPEEKRRVLVQNPRHVLID